MPRRRRRPVGERDRIPGLAASPGRAMGPARRIRWEIPSPPHRTIRPDEVGDEIARFEAAVEGARIAIRELREHASRTLGEVEAKIFDPQILMLEDPEIVEGTCRYIRENFLAADRAFDWRITELRAQILEAAHLMILDRIADLRDVRHRVLARLAGRQDDPLAVPTEPCILVFEDLTPSVAVRLDRERTLALVVGAGTRSSHSAILARSMGVPAVVGVGGNLDRIPDGVVVLVDGGAGTVIVEPTPEQIEMHRRAEARLTEMREKLATEGSDPLVTTDGERVHLRANLDQPDDVARARAVAAEGVGLFRSEFLVIGQRVIPTADEQYRAYRKVLDGFPGQPVTLRTFDIGGDKFPLFLEMPPEENPYLGWRAIRVCLDLPDLFRNQLSAALRAGEGSSRLRVLLPFVVSIDEVLRTRAMLEEEADRLGVDPSNVPLGVMVETPAVVETLDLVAPHVDFISLGTNDLTQYTLAVDRGNARLAHLADSLHPALVRMYRRVCEEGLACGLEVSVCGDLATDPEGLALLLGLGYRDFSVAPTRLPEIRELIGTLSAADLAMLCASTAASGSDLRRRLRAYLEETSPFETRPLPS